MANNRFFKTNDRFIHCVDHWQNTLPLEDNRKLARLFKKEYGSDILLCVESKDCWLSIDLKRQTINLMVYHVDKKIMTEHVVTEELQTRKDLVMLMQLYKHELPQRQPLPKPKF